MQTQLAIVVTIWVNKMSKRQQIHIRIISIYLFFYLYVYSWKYDKKKHAENSSSSSQCKFCSDKYENDFDLFKNSF